MCLCSGGDPGTVTARRIPFKCQEPELKSINREDWLCSGNGVSSCLVLHFKAEDSFPGISGTQHPSCPAGEELGRLEVLSVLPQGAFPCGVGGLPRIPPVPIPQEGSSGAVGIEMEQQIHPCRHAAPVDSPWCWLILGSGQPRAFPHRPGTILVLKAASLLWLRRLVLWSSSLQAWLWKTHIGGSRWQGHSREGRLPSTQPKTSRFFFFLRIFPVFPHPNPQKTFLTSMPHQVNWVIVNY